MRSTHIALLRGVNVGRARRIAMADLRRLIAGLGYRSVRTLLASGNVVFVAPARPGADHAARIRKALAEELGVTVPVFVVGVDDLAAALADDPLHCAARDPSRRLVALTATAADQEKLAALGRQAWSPELLAVAGRVAYLWCAGGIGASPLFAAVNRSLGDAVTTRNWSTMEKLLALARTPP